MANAMITEDQKLTYAGFVLLKMLDLSTDEGGTEIPVVLPHELAPLEPALDRLLMESYIEIDRKRGRYALSSRGLDYIGVLIDEAEAYIDEFDEVETSQLMQTLRRRNLDPMRVRLLWGWYQGELDDLVLFQQRRGMSPVERDWAMMLLSDALYDELGRDLQPE